MLQGPLAFFLKKKNSGRENSSDAAGMFDRPTLDTNYITTLPLELFRKFLSEAERAWFRPFLERAV